MSSGIRTVEIQNKGRATVASRPLKAGEIILKESPILLYSAAPSSAAANYCSNCFRILRPDSQTTVPCPHCSTASFFCSPQCQSIALSTSHTPFVCQALTRLLAADSPLLHHHDRLAQARFLVSAYNLALVSPSHFQMLLSLQGDSIVDEASVFLHSLISSVCPVPNLDQFGLKFSVELTSALLAKDKLNAFGLMEPFDENKERSVRAYGIYPKASFFNHDCLPNVCRYDYVDLTPNFTNTDIVVRVIHDLPEGREICLSYFPVNLKFLERQQRLKEDYGFTCDCDRCKVEANWSDDEEEEEEMDDDDDDDEEEEEEEEDGMDEDLETEDSGMAKGNNDFPHAYFFMRYMCNRDNCWGTLAPLHADSRVMECNVCGNLSNSEDLMDGNQQLK